MTTLKKRMLLHCILALGIFLGFGFISLPGPHGGLILTIGWLADILIHPVDGVKSLLLFYLPIAGDLLEQAF